MPLLVYSPSMSHSVALGDRHSFADIGETVLQNFGLKQWGIGSSFLDSLRDKSRIYIYLELNRFTLLIL